MKKAVFLDRDGVINQLIFNTKTGEYESPHFVDDLVIYPYVAKSLIELKSYGYMLFLISNQPSYAKGKTTFENIKAIHNEIHSCMVGNGIKFDDYFYCYHHPNGTVPEYTFECQCRKPKPFFLQEAGKKYGLDMARSWLIGDQDSDIFCGKAGGVRTILINNEHSSHKRGKSRPDYQTDNLLSAVELITQLSYTKNCSRALK